MGRDPGCGAGRRQGRRRAGPLPALAIALGLATAAAPAGAEEGGFKRVTAPEGGALGSIEGVEGFAGHSAAPRGFGAQVDRLKRFNQKIVHGPNGAVLRVIVGGPKPGTPPRPRAKPVRLAAAAAAAKLAAPGAVRIKPGLRPLGWPLSGVAISSGFGLREHPILGGPRPHRGVDLAAPPGTPVRAAADGRVEIRAWRGGYGRFVLIDHGFGLKTAYGHLRGYAAGLRPGQRVGRGQVIGYVGSSGRSTGPHLHYEVRINGRAVDPVKFLPTIPRRVRVRS